MSDLISATLREQADGDIHIERLLANVHTGARRRRLRNLAVSAGALVAVAALVAAGGVAIWRTPGAPVGVARPPFTSDIPRPPLVEGVPVATTSPTVIGSDPTLFHLDLTGLDTWASLTWSSRTGYEDLRGFSSDAGGDFFVEATQFRDKLSGQAGEIGYTTVNGLPAERVRITQPVPGQNVAPLNPPGARSAVRWEAAPDVWVQVVVGGDPGVAMEIAERVRLDRTYRCAIPFRLTRLDQRVRVVKCDLTFAGSNVYGGTYLIDGPQGVDYKEYYVAVGWPITPTAPTEMIGGRAVAVVPGDPAGASEHLEYPYDGGVAYFFPFYTTLADPFLRSLVPAFDPVVSTDPRAWPRSPLG